MDIIEKLQQIADFQAVNAYVPSYILTDENREERQDEGLGIAISKYCQWDGIQIMKIFMASLEDANFHGEASKVQGWLDKFEDEMLEGKEE